MANGFLVLNEKDWEKMSPDQRQWATFNTLQSMNARLITLERKSLVNRICVSIGAVVGGAAGGIAASLGLKH